jgi:hypothetical protein
VVGTKRSLKVSVKGVEVIVVVIGKVGTTLSTAGFGEVTLTGRDMGVPEEWEIMLTKEADVLGDDKGFSV